MRSSKAVLLLCPLLIALQGCCLFDCDWKSAKICEDHPEQPFDVGGGPPGPGLVFASADFNGSGSVLIKIQVEDLSAISGNNANITAWSGNGPAPTTNATPPAGGSEFHSSGGDAGLRYWTTHINRDYDETVNRYWVFVKVDHRQADGTRLPKFLWWEWVPSSTVSPDTPHDFNQY